MIVPIDSFQRVGRARAIGGSDDGEGSQPRATLACVVPVTTAASAAFGLSDILWISINAYRIRP